MSHAIKQKIVKVSTLAALWRKNLMKDANVRHGGISIISRYNYWDFINCYKRSSDNISGKSGKKMFPYIRRHERFNIFIMVEFQSLKTPSKCYLGITRNFSFKGFSFESLNYNPQIGEALKFKFKHPQDNSYVFTSGEIVWKHKNNERECFTGIKCIGIDRATKRKMLEIASLAGKIPFDSFLTDKAEKDIHDETTKATNHEFFVDEPETAGRVEEAHDETFDLDTEEHKDNGLPIEHGRATYDNTSPARKDRIKKMWLHIPIAIAAVVTLFVLVQIFSKVLTSPIPVSTASASYQDIDKKHFEHTAIDAQAVNKVLTIPAPLCTESAFHQEIDKNLSEHTVVDDQTSIVEYYIQVGAWKYPDYAQDMFVKLNPFYPAAYIFIQNNFHKIRIPGITNEKEGAKISQHIEEKFNIKPIVVRKIK